MGNISFWFFSKLPNQLPKTPRFISSCAQSPLARPVLTSIQSIITILGQQKSSFTRKVKATTKPIGTFLWRSFYSRLCRVLKKIGLLSSFLSIFKDAKIICKAFPPPYEKKQKPSCMNLSIIPEESEPLDFVTKAFCVSSQIAHSEILPKQTKELVFYFPKASVSYPMNEETRPLQLQTPNLQKAQVSYFPLPVIHISQETFYENIEILSPLNPLIKAQKAQITYTPWPTIHEESVLSTLLQKSQVTKEEFFGAASELFEKELIERMQSWEQVSLPENLTQPDLLHAFALMGHGITTDNLNQLLIRVNQGEVYLQLSKKAEDLSQLSTQDIKKLVDFFRNPLEHLLPGEAKILWEELEKVLGQLPKDFNSKRVAYTKYEYHIHRLAEEAKSFIEEEKKLLFLASSEQIAKFAGYAKPDTICKNMIIPILTKKHGLIYHKLEDHINEKGLHCYLFNPINKELSLPAQLIFRGTDGIESMKRDILDTNGIGKTVFDTHKEKIATMINSYCKATEKPALEICGHSLGAIDAQRALAFCVELFNEKVRYPPISKLSHISCSAFCSPKLDDLTIDQWEKEVNKLKSSALELELNFAYHEKDIVTWVGYKNLFIPEDLTTQANLQANYLHVTSPSGLLTTIHHRIPFFNGARFDSTIDNRKYDFYTKTKLAELKTKQAELEKLKNEVLVFLDTEKDRNNNPSIDLNSLERLNTTLDSIHASDENEPFVMIDFGETEQALQAIELSMNEAYCLKEKIHVNQTGLSSKDSWLIYLLEKALISPTQTTVSYLL
ncbi:hypothetical protein RHABOEDO_001182 [Candidatus Rhabdochlamydia oedothoracis]|uniref:Fungal lipase-like domain-containing protein n=2 Tax=Candidatus Rhabdochlamydia TaxID=292833 RepID=A0ABX8V6T0_9BACT|nr:hypothetical protein [Candidatus Rhabdochlamydia oedothoracis]KAG6558972.1 hypothetical protein RHOW815_001037 [Candidatus Rhabdochlamydia sp. W815]QYF48939.1 hypothetical protein RHABOEDO_001182 [Candidatus Rhabdochlamydia oedothoracis]